MIKFYFLKTGLTVAGKVNAENDEVLEDVLQIQVMQTMSPQGVNLRIKFLPLGFPINNRENEFINKSDLNILFEITNFDKNLEQMYEEDLLNIKSPNIVKPKKSKIIS